MDLGKLNDLAVHRVCRQCGAEFKSDPAKDGVEAETALQKFCEHIKSHQHTVEQWSMAHELIQAGKLRKEPLTHKHTHKCRKCGRVWNCGLNAGSEKKPKCHWDNDPDCVKCPA